MTANGIGFKSKYEIDDFISRLLASRKFDELADKVADKAVHKIKEVEIPDHFERVRETNSKNENEKPSVPEKNYEEEILHKIKKQEDSRIRSFVGKINTEAVMKEGTNAQSDHLRLKYKYLTRNVNDKGGPKVHALDDKRHNKTPTVKNNEKSENIPKQASDKEVHKENNEQAGPLPNQDVNEKEQEHSGNEFEKKVSVDRYPAKEAKGVKSKRHQVAPIVKDAVPPNRYLVKDGHEEADPISNPDNNQENNTESVYSDTNVNKDRERPDTKDDNLHNEPDTPENAESRQEPDYPNEPPKERPSFKSKTKSIEVTEENANNNYDSTAEHSEPSGEKVKEDDGKSKIIKEEFHGEDEAPNFRGHEDSNNSKYEQDNEVGQEEENRGSETEEELSSTIKPVIRQEGRKLYTYVQHPDYVEYYEQAAREKQRKPEDFL